MLVRIAPWALRLAHASWMGLGIVALLCARVHADTGVSEQRVVLPDGPGSLGGVGENANVDLNMGLVQYAVPFALPEGYPEVTPQLGLSYSSGSGSSEVGIGWSLKVPAIERMSLRGLPEYTADDEFAANGDDELVRISGSAGVDVYRARFEGTFIRYTFYQQTSKGAGGYWKAELPSGTVAYYGADDKGKADASARVTTPEGGVFRYHLVTMVDKFGHRTRYRYVKSGSYALLSAIEYVESADGPRFSVRLEYADRNDVISTCVPGFDLRLTQRLTRVRVYSRAQQIRSYVLSYDDEASAGGFSRLRRVTEYGLGDEKLPISFSFQYSRALEGSCSACEQPYIVDAGSLPGGVDFATGRSTLIDINGDALPDVLQSSDDGRHTFYTAKLSSAGKVSFAKPIASASTENGSSFVLGLPAVQVIDVNGDGFTDIVSSRAGTVLCNTGAGDWSGSSCLKDSTLPEMSDDEEDGPSDANPLHVRFLDYDNDKRIDMIRTLTGQTEVFRNTGSAFESRLVDHIGAQFDESRLELADMNGDGLLDPTQLLVGGTVRYRLNLGFGRWSDWVEATAEGLDDASFSQAEIEDLNGDGLSDVVVVSGTTVSVAINRNGARFDAFRTWASEDVQGDIPERSSTTTVLFADMNGTGSTEVVWITNQGALRFLELYPVKPHLLSRIENGLGSVQTFVYGASVDELARDLSSDPWPYRLPHSMNVVIKRDQWVTLTGGEQGEGLHEVTSYRYHDGFYDGHEKGFRGYARVEAELAADRTVDSQDGALSEEHFDVGASDVYRKGLLLRSQISSEAGAPIAESRNEYKDCPLAGIPDGLRLPVRHVCEVASLEIQQEGRPTSEWVTTREEYVYDGYGQVPRRANLGVIHFGPPEAKQACQACLSNSDLFGAPCGKSCAGDEKYVDTTYIAPGSATSGAWILGRASATQSYAKKGGATTETRIHYDGKAFEGLPAGKLTQGLVSLAEERRSEASDDLIARIRHAYDKHGNIIEALDPNGSAKDETGHRRRYVFDELGLNLMRADLLLSDDQGPYSLRRTIAYNATFNLPSESTDWVVVRNGKIRSEANTARYRYDAFGRTSAIMAPGDTDSTPSQVFAYELEDPVSRVVVKQRSVVGGPLDLEVGRCMDGVGREVQRRTLIGKGSYQISGFAAFNRRGEVVRSYQPYLSTSADCEKTAPKKVLFTGTRYDAVGRPVEVTMPDASLHRTASTERMEHRPLATFSYDAEDTDPSSPHADTPLVEEVDGLGRLVALRRFLKKGERAPASTLLRYDGLGNLAEVEDPDGRVRRQRFDLLGRVVEVDEPDAGKTRYEYDAAGNLTREEDASGGVTRMQYDGANRLLTEYDAEDPRGSSVRYRYDVAVECDACSHVEGQIARIDYPLGAKLGEGYDRFGYDVRGRNVYAERSLLGHAFVTRYNFDNAGRIFRAQYPDGTALSRHYDGASRLTAIGGAVDKISYDERGLPQRLVYADKTSSELSHDVMMRLGHLRTASPKGDVLQGYEYDRDRVGNLREIHDEVEDAGDAAYTHDAWYRPRRVRLSAKEGIETLDFDFDIGDRITKATSSLGTSSPAHIGTYEYDSRHPQAVARAGGRSYQYDAAGRMRERGKTQLDRDYRGRLESAKAGPVDGWFAYGPDDARVLKQEGDALTYYVGPDFEIRDGIATVYARVGRERVARLESDALAAKVLPDLAPATKPDGRIDAADAWLAVEANRDDATLGQILRSSARRLLLDTGSDRTILHHDHLGSATLATVDGEVVGRQRFYPAGQVRSGEGYVDPYAFTGQERDESTELSHFRYRDLDTSIGRWASPDPLFGVLTADAAQKLGEATTSYAYVGNAWDGAFDPTGLAKHKASASKTAKPKALGIKLSAHKFKSHAKVTAYKKRAVPAKFAKIHNRIDTYYGNKKSGGSGDNITPDHIPSNAAVAYFIASKYPAHAGVTKRSSPDGRALESRLPTLNVQETDHVAGETYGGKNTVAQIQSDGASLGSLLAAMKRDLDHYEYTTKTLDSGTRKTYEAATTTFLTFHLHDASSVAAFLGTTPSSL